MNVQPPKFREGDKVYYNGLGIKKRLTISNVRWVEEETFLGFAIPDHWEYDFHKMSLAAVEDDISLQKFYA